MGSFGFLLKHKGQLELVEAFERLPGWDELLLLCATIERSGKMEAKINSLIEKKGLTGRVKLVTDFLDDDVVIASLAKCELLVFPYQNTKESASGAVRMGVAAGVPLAVTPIPIFDDVTGAIRMRGGTVDDIVASISKISQDDLESSRKSMVELRDSLQWDEVAKRIQALLK
jgi:glycosyltransferase involved in cell wall biosynthesis